MCSGFFKGRYALLNTQGEIVGEFGEYPNFWSKEVNFPVSARAMFHQAAFVKHPTKAMFSSYSSHVIEIYSFENNRLAPDLIKKIPLGNYSYTYTTGNTLSAKKGNDVEKGIVDIACTSDYIYLVYDLSLNSNQNLDTRIMVIDWQGKPVKALTTKMNITCLFLDDEEMRAYCIVKNPEDTLAYFDLEN